MIRKYKGKETVIFQYVGTKYCIGHDTIVMFLHDLILNFTTAQSQTPGGALKIAQSKTCVG